MHKLDWVHKTRHDTDNVLSPVGRYAFTLMLLTYHHSSNWKQISFESKQLSLKEMGMQMSSVECRPFCLGLNMHSTTQTI